MVLQDGASPREKPYTGHHGGFPFIRGGVPLATSRLSSNNPDLQDVASVMDAFETINKCSITLHGKVVGVAGARKLQLIVSAMETNEDLPDQGYLASVNVDLGCGSHRTMEGAMLWALYQLDWRLAEIEVGRVEKTA